jgi:hypothetical protein
MVDAGLLEGSADVESEESASLLQAASSESAASVTSGKRFTDVVFMSRRVPGRARGGTRDGQSSPGATDVVSGDEVVVEGRYAGIEYLAGGNSDSVGVEALLEHAEMSAVARRAGVTTRRATFMLRTCLEQTLRHAKNRTADWGRRRAARPGSYGAKHSRSTRVLPQRRSP